MAPALQRQLESLSQYTHIYPPNTANDALNPTNFQYAKVSFGGKQLCVLSRVSDAGLDYSRRSNLLAHHIALDPDERNVSGPAALIDSLLLPPSIKRWEKPPQREDIRSIPNPPCPTSPMASHNSFGVKPEIVGEIAGRLANSTQQIVTVLYRQDQHSQLLSLVKDIFWLLPPGARWNTTFSTYYSAHVQNTDCRLRFIPHGTPNAERVSLDPGTIDLNENMTVLDSEMVRAALEAAKTGNRTLAHPRAAESVHSTGEGFTRAQSPVSGPRPPIGGPDLHLKPPPISQRLTQAQSNQDRHKNPETVEVGKFSENQDRHSSGARKKLVIAISILSLFLLLGIIAAVVMTNPKHGSSDSVTHRKKGENGNEPKNGNGSKGQKGEREKGENSEKGNPQDGSDANKSSSMGEKKGPSADGNKEMNPEDGSKENGENVNDMSETPLTTGTTTEYKVHLKERDILYVDHQTLMSEATFHKKIYDDQNKFSTIREKRISLRQSQSADLKISQTDERVNQITLGLKSEGDQELLDIELTDDPDNQLVFKWREEIDPAKVSDLKNKLSTELIKAVLLVPYLMEEETSESHQKVKMRVVAFGSMNENPILERAFSEDGYYRLSRKDSSALVTAVDSASKTEGSLLRVIAALPKYDTTLNHLNIVKTVTLKAGDRLFDIPSFWGEADLQREKQQNYVPQISLQLDLKDESDVKMAFLVSEVRRAIANNESKSDVFEFLNGYSITEYVWDEDKYVPKSAPPGENKDKKKLRDDDNKKIKEEAKEFHRRTSLNLAREFLQKKPTSTYQIKQSAISRKKLKDWEESALRFQLKKEDGMRLSDKIMKLKSTIKISEQLFDHLPDFSRLDGEDLRDVFNGEFGLYINRNKSEPIQFPITKRDELKGFKNQCSQHIKSNALEPGKLKEIVDSLTNWAKTLHGVIRIDGNLGNGIPIKIQIEVLQSFKLPSTYGTDDNISMADNSIQEGQESDDLVLPILRLGDVNSN
tara:strand:- start:3621 stop:6590 length:2970 start_codon:yes stop_codon:yes gene_type:complete